MGLFGSITRSLFGGSKNESQSESGNVFRDQTAEQFSPWAGYGTQGMGQMSALLGLGGNQANADAADAYWNSTGGDFLLNQGLDDVDAFYRAKGLGQSGAAMKGMENYRSGLASTKLGEQTAMLGDLNRLSLGAGGLVSDAGRYNESQGSGSNGNGGFGKFLGGLLVSDPDLKTDIEKTGSIGTYRFRYKGEPTVYHGIMADEVEDKLPEAAGPKINGYRTVNMSKLLEAMQ